MNNSRTNKLLKGVVLGILIGMTSLILSTNTCLADEDVFQLGDPCTIGRIPFIVVDNTSTRFYKLASEHYSMTIGKTKLVSICNETKLHAIRERRILWVGKR